MDSARLSVAERFAARPKPLMIEHRKDKEFTQ
jgi:hypothetical protein